MMKRLICAIFDPVNTIYGLQNNCTNLSKVIQFSQRITANNITHFLNPCKTWCDHSEGVCCLKGGGVGGYIIHP